MEPRKVGGAPPPEVKQEAAVAAGSPVPRGTAGAPVSPKPVTVLEIDDETGLQAESSAAGSSLSFLTERGDASPSPASPVT